MATSAAVKRLVKEHRELISSPILGVSACPNEDDMLCWHANIALPLTPFGTVPMHIVIMFTPDYPASAPNAGFAVHFPYNMGASYIGSSERDGKYLSGCQIICLDILGNFSRIHTEWAKQPGSGWSPAYSVSTLLLNLQALLLELDVQLSRTEKSALYNEAMAYTCKIGDNTHSGTSPYPPLEASSDAPIAADTSSDTSGAKLTGMSSEGKLVARCYFTLASHEDDTLGYGIYFDRSGKPKSYGELISWTAFHEHKLRQTSRKESFTHFIPAFINPQHASNNPQWVRRTKQSLEQSARACSGGVGSDDVPPALQVLPALINSMVVEINRGDKASAIAFFEALCSFWRTLRWYIVVDTALSKDAVGRVQRFIDTPAARHKNNVPDVGALLALATSLVGAFSLESFIDAYLDESFVRCVMWWRDECAAQARAVFVATAVSRSIFHFQMEVLRIVIGDAPDVTATKMDQSYGRLPERLEALQCAWKARIEPRTWGEYAIVTGCSVEMRRRIGEDPDQWIMSCVQRSIENGPLYQKGARGGRGGGGGKGGKGKGGKGAGKGGGRGGR